MGATNITVGHSLDRRPAQLQKGHWARLAAERVALERRGARMARRAMERPISEAARRASHLLANLPKPDPWLIGPRLARFVRAWEMGPDLDLRLLIDREGFGLGHQAGYALLERALDGATEEDLSREAEAALAALTPSIQGDPFLAKRDGPSGLIEFVCSLPQCVEQFRSSSEVRRRLESERSELTYQPARWFVEHGIPADRLRQAATATRKTQRVRKIGEGRATRYCVQDVRLHWPHDFQEIA